MFEVIVCEGYLGSWNLRFIGHYFVALDEWWKVQAHASIHCFDLKACCLSSCHLCGASTSLHQIRREAALDIEQLEKFRAGQRAVTLIVEYGVHFDGALWLTLG